MAVVQGEGHSGVGGMGAFSGHEGRHRLKMGEGLLPPPKSLRDHHSGFQGGHSAPSGYVCEPRKCQVGSVLFQVAPLPGSLGGRSLMPFGGIVRGLRQPPVVNHPTVAAPVEGESQCGLSFGGSPLGFCHE